MNIRNRVVGLQHVPARSLRPNPRNWRTHSKQQRDVLRGLLAEVGFAAPVIARRCEDGSLQLIDGHLRSEELGDAVVPVVVLDVTAAEADKLLVTMDPLAALAGQDDARLAELLSEVTTDSAAVMGMLGELYKLPEEGATGDGSAPGVDETAKLTHAYEIVISCATEQEQLELLERLNGEGLTCRSLIT